MINYCRHFFSDYFVIPCAESEGFVAAVVEVMKLVYFHFPTIIQFIDKSLVLTFTSKDDFAALSSLKKQALNILM